MKNIGKKRKIRQTGLHKIKKFCASKANINRVIRQPAEWEKIFANHTSDKRLISRI